MTSTRRLNPDWNWHPQLPLENSPLFVWPPRPTDIARWFARSWLKLSMTVIILALSMAVWTWLQPPLERFETFAPDWIGQILLRNALLITALAGSLHLYLHRAKRQGDRHKFTTREFARNNRTFTLNNQVRDNVLWSLASGVPIWSGYEVLYLWALANSYIPALPATFPLAWMVAWLFLTPLWLSFHFYWVHRLLHWPPVYRRVHSLHHRNVHIGPWSGLSMHPFEHILYFSSILIHVIVASNPLIMYFHLYLQALNPVASHSGFNDLLIKGKSFVPLGVFFHQLHHRHFNCNLGTAEVPCDQWHGSFHDGSAEATARARARAKNLR